MAKERLSSKLAVILHADIAGSTALVQQDEQLAHERIQETFHRFGDIINNYHGRVRELRGDALLAEFERASDAVIAALAFQADQIDYNAQLNDKIRPTARVGIAMGEVIIADDTITGAGVVLAQRLEQLAKSGGVCIQGAAYETVPQRLPFDYRNLGEQQVKGFQEPVRAYVTTLKSGEKIPEPEPPGSVTDTFLGRAISSRLTIGTMVLLVMVGGGLTWWQPWLAREEPKPIEQTVFALPDKPSIAVLPFTNMSNDAEQDYFADGMTDDLITDLSKLSGLFVIARNSVFTYKGQAVKVQQVAEELGVRYVLEGSIRRAADRVRINAQLIDATTGGHLWAERYDGSITDVFALQDKVTAKIVSALAVNLTATEKTQVARMPTRNLEAYDYYLRANRGFWVYSSQGRIDALSLYQKAITLDPTFADAYAGIADAAAAVWYWDESSVLPAPVARKHAYEAASRALALDPQNARAYSVLGMMQMADSRHDEAIASMQKSISLDPNNADTYTYLARVLSFAGQHTEALAAMKTAFRLNPIPPPVYYGHLGWVLFHNRQYENAIGPLDKALAGGVEVLSALAMTYAQLGRLDEARAMVDQILKNFPSANLAYFRTVNAHYKRAEDLEHILDARRKAGIPEWPFGYNGRPQDRLDERAIAALIFGQTWNGHSPDGAPFFQEISKDGKVAFRSPASLMTGTAWVEGGMLCYQFSAAALSRKSCGYLFRNPGGTRVEQNEYIQVGLTDILYFSIKL